MISKFKLLLYIMKLNLKRINSFIVSILVTSCENRHGTRTLTPAMQINKMSSMDRKSVCHQEMVDRLRDEHNGADLGLADKGSFLTYVI